MVGGKKGATQHLLKLCFRRITGIDPRRATDDAITQNRCRDFADAKPVVAYVARAWCLRLGLNHTGGATKKCTRGANHRTQHYGAPVQRESVHVCILRSHC
jgi:hypothetical protein